jgi:hypothetical protein
MFFFLLSGRFLSSSCGSVDYAKKKEKRAQIKFVRDETVQKDDQYKSHTVHVPSGEPPNSRSRPPAKRKAGVVRPVTQGKLLKSGGPSKVRSVVDGRFVALIQVVTVAFGNPTATSSEAASRRFCSGSCHEAYGFNSSLHYLTWTSPSTSSRSCTSPSS